MQIPESVDARLFAGLVVALGAIGAVAGVLWRRGCERDRRITDLEESNERLVDLVDGAGIVVWQTTAQPDAGVSLNRAAQTFFGFDSPVVTLARLVALIHPDDRSRVTSAWKEAIGAGGTHLLEARLTIPGGPERTVVNRMIITRGASPLATVVRCALLDVTEQRQAQHRLLHSATHDPLTGLANRVGFLGRVDIAIAAAKRAQHRLAVLSIDLTGFHDVNDTLGHDVGDQLLAAIGRRLAEALRDTDAVARLFGDHFAVAGHVDDVIGARRLAERVREMLASPFEVTSAASSRPGTPVATFASSASSISSTAYPPGHDDLLLSARASIGIAVFPEHGNTADSLLQASSVALARCKVLGIAHQLYSAELHHSVRSRLSLISELQDAIEGGKLEARYRPAVDLSTGDVAWLEAVPSWHHERLGDIDPDEFATLVDVGGLVVPLTRWLVRQTIADGASWRHAGLDLPVQVPLSTRCVQTEPIDQWLLGALTQVGTKPSRYGVSLTEWELITDRSAVEGAFIGLRNAGIATTLHEFGSGFSSLGYLRDLAVDAVTIDASFIERLSMPRDRTIVRAMIDLAHELGVRVVADGVGDERVVETLMQLGCDIVQGSRYGKPVPPGEVREAIASWTRAPRSSTL